MNEKAKLDIEALRSLHRFGDIFEQAINAIDSPLVELTPQRQAQDSIGRHWYGMRCSMVCKKTGQGFYLHMGLIYLPETRTGLMVELDRKNNLPSYGTVWDKIADTSEFEVNRDEEEYLKLFMPEVKFAHMQNMSRIQQSEALARYIQSCAESIAAAAYTEGFNLSYEGLSSAYKLALNFEEALKAVKNPLYTVEINYKDPDNFGQYASGYRYWLRSADGRVELYAYFGCIYSYKKSPAGIFSEIDWFSNQKHFDHTFANMMDHEAYMFSRAEPKFIKLFFTQEREKAFNEADSEGQLKLLAEFLDICNAQMIIASQK